MAGYKAFWPAVLASFTLEAADGQGVSPPATGISDANRDGSYRVTTWTIEHGLPDNRVQTVLQTRDGFLWLGTVSGLVRFDGVRLKVFTHHNAPAFRSDDCLALAEDRDGILWIGTGEGLIRYAGRAFTYFGKTEGLPELTVARLVAASSGGVWAGTENAVTRVFADRVWHSQRFPRLWAQNGAFYEDEAGKVHLAGERLSSAGETNLPPDEPVTQRFVAADGTTWLATPARLYRVAPRARRPELVWQARAPEEAISALTGRPEGGLWLGTVGGAIFSWRDGQETRVGEEHGLAAGLVHSLTVDREGSLWAGTEEGGLLRIWRTVFRALAGERKVAAENDTWAICEAPDGTIWAATDGGLLGFAVEGVRRFTVADGLPANSVKALLIDRHHTLWIGTGRGVATLRAGRIEQVRLPGDLGGNKVRVIFEDTRGAIWVGAAKGVHRLAGQEQTWLTATNGLPREDVRAIHQDAAGRIWLGTFGGGIAVLEPGGPRLLTIHDGLPSDYVCELAVDGGGTLWVGTSRGLAVWRGHRFRSLTSQQGLREDTINGIVDDGVGGLWVSGNSGIYRLDRAELNAWLEDRANRLHPAWFGAADGLPSDETNGEKSSPTGLRTSRGEILFPTTRGVAVIDPRRVWRKPVRPLAAIDVVRVDDTVLWGDQVAGEVESPAQAGGRSEPPGEIDRRQPLAATLRPGSGRLLEIEYTASAFTAPNRTRFRYRLEGLEDTWTEANERRTAYYTRLRPGHYRFVVMAYDTRGNASERGAEFAFTLQPRFFETSSFLATMAGVLVALGAGLWQLKLSIGRRLRRAEELRLVDRERTRIARDIHDDLGAALTRIVFRSEMVARNTLGSANLEAAASGIAEAAREAVQSLAEVVWATNPGRDDLESLANFICQRAEKLLEGLPARLHLEVQQPLPALPLSSDVRHNLYQVVKEALNNAMKHAAASKIVIRLAVNDGELRIAVEDDGCGFDSQAPASEGNGLENMRSRITALGGTLELVSQPGRGTKVEARVRLPGLPVSSRGPRRGQPSRNPHERS